MKILTLRLIHKRQQLETVRVEKAIYLNLSLENQPYNFLIDTGCQQNIIYRESLNKKPLNLTQHHSGIVKVYTAAGNAVNCTKMSVTITLPSDEGRMTNVYTPFLIMENPRTLTYDGLLGIDFLEKIKGVLDITHSSLSYSL
jgi:hypothetical protein